jgi:phenylacetate-coenzyme A ligase PaaK-like adenylate-forming protein
VTDKLTLNTTEILHATPGTFDGIALSVFQHQYLNNPIYNAYCKALGKSPSQVTEVRDIPFLPISFFKTHQVVSGNLPKDCLYFESSGTTGSINSRHYVKDVDLYNRSLLQGFELFYGKPNQYAVLALLPSYLERNNASLVHMVRTLMQHSGHEANGFYKDDWISLHSKMQQLEQQGQKALLVGVTFALIDFAEQHPSRLENTIVMETGGMKGRKEEWTRSRVHQLLQQQLGLATIHSEYGMTELLSQAYSNGGGIYTCTNTMRVLVRDINDPLSAERIGAGCINVIDLANVHSCSFLATEDVGKVHENGTFEIIGRLDHSALRGCSLMTA